jgi:PAS domain S-box-containing protein
MEKIDKHMACIDLAFKLSGTEFTDIEQVENNELTAMYAVSAFSLSGGEDNLSVVITGTKQLMFGRVKLRTPKIEITENSSYMWHEDLLNCINTLRREVQLYHEGKCAAELNAPKEAEIEFDLEGNIIFANQLFLDTMGYSNQEEIVGKHHRIFIDEDHSKSEDYYLFWKKLNEGILFTGEITRVKKDGSLVYLQATYNPILGLDGKIYRVMKIATDVSNSYEQRKEIAELKQLVQDALSFGPNSKFEAETKKHFENLK